MTEIEKVLRELVQDAHSSQTDWHTPGRQSLIKRAESMLARLSEERPVAYRVKTDRGTVINGWMDGAPNAMVIAHAAQDGYSIELAYSRRQLAEVAAWRVRIDDGRTYCGTYNECIGFASGQSAEYTPLHAGQPKIAKEPLE